MKTLFPLLFCAWLSSVMACSSVTVRHKGFEPLAINAKRPKSRVELTDKAIKINEKVQFAFDSAEIKPASFGLLNEVAEVIEKNPRIELVRVEGHTDSTGEHDYNVKLSKERAKSVMAYLVKQGIKPKRLVSEGYGPDKPIASNDNEKGQGKNRRVEFNIVKQKDQKK